MIRRFLLRLPVLRAFPRVNAPILPLRRAAAAAPLLTRTTPSRFFQNFPARLTTTSSSLPSPDGQPRPQEHVTLSQRLRTLVKTYGWYALGMYAVLSILDFGVAFVGINLLGAEQVAKVVASAKGLILGFLPSKPPEPGHEEMDSPTRVGEAGHEGFYAVLVLAYTVHKTLFLPVRVGLTAALTPRLVGWLSRRGWAGGEGTRRAAADMRDRLRGSRERD